MRMKIDHRRQLHLVMNHEQLVEVLHAVDFELMQLGHELAVEVEHFDWVQLKKEISISFSNKSVCH